MHGVYKPGNVILRPELLGKHQAYCKQQLKSDDDRPLYLVFHGGSGSSKEEIALALKFGVVKVSYLFSIPSMTVVIEPDTLYVADERRHWLAIWFLLLITSQTKPSADQFARDNAFYNRHPMGVHGGLQGQYHTNFSQSDNLTDLIPFV